MAKKTEDVGAGFLLEVIDAVDENEQVALDAIARFVAAVDDALPGGDKKRTPRGRVDVVEAALKMIEQLLGVSNDVARRLTESVRQALPEIERNIKTTAKKAAAKKASAQRSAKKATAKKATAKKATAKKATAKKATAKKATAKKATARKAPAKRSAKKATAKRS
jgi:DNA-binding protein HU-beta